MHVIASELPLVLFCPLHAILRALKHTSNPHCHVRVSAHSFPSHLPRQDAITPRTRTLAFRAGFTTRPPLFPALCIGVQAKFPTLDAISDSLYCHSPFGFTPRNRTSTSNAGFIAQNLSFGTRPNSSECHSPAGFTAWALPSIAGPVIHGQCVGKPARHPCLQITTFLLAELLCLSYISWRLPPISWITPMLAIAHSLCLLLVSRCWLSRLESSSF